MFFFFFLTFSNFFFYTLVTYFFPCDSFLFTFDSFLSLFFLFISLLGLPPGGATALIHSARGLAAYFVLFLYWGIRFSFLSLHLHSTNFLTSDSIH